MNPEVAAKLAALHAAVAGLRELPWQVLPEADLLAVCAGVQDAYNGLPTVEQTAIAVLAEQTTPKKIGAKSWPEALRIRLRISGKEARRRLRDAHHLGPRFAVTGEVLPARRAVIAAAQAGGWLTPDHVAILHGFFTKCPGWVEEARLVEFEQKLTAAAAQDTPEALQHTVDEALYLLDQDGPVPVEQRRAQRRGLYLGPQDSEGMSRLYGIITPELRAHLEPGLEKYGAPGMCNPDDEAPCASGTPSQDQIDADTRTPGQRTHDALLAITRTALMTGDLGQHNGLPASIVVTTTLQELEAGAGVAVTAGGTRLPIPDLIRLAAHAWHYLAVFDQHTNIALHLGRTKRVASVGQRLMLFARDRGCTRPGCTACGYRCQAHHGHQDWQHGGETNIDDLTLACGPDNGLVTTYGWTTKKGPTGRYEWTPPPLLDWGQARINYHHRPQHYLTEDDDDETDCRST